MCLYTKEKSRIKSGVGYKMVYPHKGEVYAGLCAYRNIISRGRSGDNYEDCLDGCSLLRKGEWVKDKRRGQIYLEGPFHNNYGHYRTGFHLYLRRKDAIHWAENMGWGWSLVPVKIEFRDVVAVGTQSHRKCIVAREIKRL